MSGATRVAVVIPAFGRTDLVSDLLADLVGQVKSLDEIVVVDNRGDLVLPQSLLAKAQARIFYPGTNLRWIGSTNWVLNYARSGSFDVAISLNSDIRASPGLIASLVDALKVNERTAVAAPCYDDFWPHQRATAIPKAASKFVSSDDVRRVAFCDGTAIAFHLARTADLGDLDEDTFSWHGYGADLDYAIRLGRAGREIVVTEGGYVTHLRRGSMDAEGQSEELALAEIESGLVAKYGTSWRALLSLPNEALRSVASPPGRVDFHAGQPVL